jgi:hypothetical protein
LTVRSTSTSAVLVLVQPPAMPAGGCTVTRVGCRDSTLQVRGAVVRVFNSH